jgi:hypothetical protein
MVWKFTIFTLHLALIRVFKLKRTRSAIHVACMEGGDEKFIEKSR